MNILLISIQSNAAKSTDAKANANAAVDPKAPAPSRLGFVDNLLNRMRGKKPPQAHLPDDKNKSVRRKRIYSVDVIYILF